MPHSELDNNFDQRALRLFDYQSVHNKIYAAYINTLGILPSQITHIQSIPFLPISFFKTQQVANVQKSHQTVFESSRTTGDTPSRHFILDVSYYLEHTQKLFENQYGKLTDYHILALLPSYLERTNSSLVYMIDFFIKNSSSEYAGFYLNNESDLVKVLHDLKHVSDRKVLLIGVTFALLDLVERHSIDFPNLLVMETGGMKGRRRELVRDEVHKILKKGFNVSRIHSEYGMTELLSQAYATHDGVFCENESIRVFVRDINDPFTLLPNGKVGGINIIDLANKDSCAFIETQDLGRKLSPTTFEVLGRFDNSDTRGCSLMVS